MGLKICSLSSGSSGNCVYISSDSTNILVDMGVSAAFAGKCLKVLGAASDEINILVTHSHSDHTKGLSGFVKKTSGSVYCHPLARPDLAATAGELKIKEFTDKEFVIGDIEVTPFALSHDVHCNGFSFTSGGKKISFATDLGRMDESVLSSLTGSDIVFLEANHDEELVRNNRHYPYFLKRRILSETGHLSNETCAATAVRLAEKGVKQFILGHLSKENNYPERAAGVVRQALSDNGLFDAGIEVAPADRMSSLFVVGG